MQLLTRLKYFNIRTCSIINAGLRKSRVKVYFEMQHFVSNHTCSAFTKYLIAPHTFLFMGLKTRGQCRSHMHIRSEGTSFF